MKWLVVLALAAACQSGESTEAPANNTANTMVIQLPKAQVTEQYRADITTLCDVVHLSGADQKPKDEQWPIVAMYLGKLNEEAHEFLVAIQPLNAEAKALALDSESKRVGLTKCELANEWRQAATARSGS
ncbi:MAG TPA: hypothetical protein VIV40_07795 [Kofleriaceae bacterium]